MSAWRVWLTLAALASGVGCSGSSRETAATTPAAQQAAASPTAVVPVAPPAPAPAAPATEPAAIVADTSYEPPANLPRGVSVGGECPDAGPDADADIAAQAHARIPLVVGLTMGDLWKASQDAHERECLAQVTSIDARAVIFVSDCGSPSKPKTRRVCRADLRHATTLLTQYSPRMPDFPGTTVFSVSQDAFAELKNKGQMFFRYLAVAPFSAPKRHLEVTMNVDGTLKERREDGRPDLPTMPVIVNDRVENLPVHDVRGVLSGGTDHENVQAKILDDPALPLILDYWHPDSQFRLQYAKITFPANDVLEHALETDKRVDVYGIYFDFNSDVLRRESGPVLREIADVLQKHADWTVGIQGHTDNVGGDALNLDLSNRRSDAVRKELVGRYGVEVNRLTTAGFGASRPKESNDTPEGRAKNRRVELVRQ